MEQIVKNVTNVVVFKNSIKQYIYLHVYNNYSKIQAKVTKILTN